MASAARLEMTGSTQHQAGFWGFHGVPGAADLERRIPDGPLSRRTPEPHSATSSVLAPVHGSIPAVFRASLGARSWPRQGT
jgi:hypothetical protein